MRALTLALLLVAGCGADPVGEGNASTEQIARLSTPEPAPETDALAAARLQALSPADLAQATMPATACRFSRDGRLLVVATQDDAIARVAGRLIHFAQTSPVGPTGGFFEDRQLSLSIGRIQSGEGPAVDARGWRARLTATSRRTGAQDEMEGFWRCGA